jgi:hypothetical protein
MAVKAKEVLKDSGCKNMSALCWKLTEGVEKRDFRGSIFEFKRDKVINFAGGGDRSRNSGNCSG